MNVPWTAAGGTAIGADWLLAATAPAGAFGRRARRAEAAFRRGDEAAARAAIARVARLAASLEPERLTALRAAIARAPDLGPLLARARAGGILGDADFFEVGRLQDALGEVAVLAPAELGDVAGPEPDAALARALAPGRPAGRGFYLDDAFDDRLARRRGEAAATQAAYDAARSRLTARIADALGVERIRDGEFVVMRDAWPPVPPPDLRVVREAPTYRLCEVALDDRALAALAARDAAAAAVADAEEDVRAALSQAVAHAAEALERACDALGRLDTLLARVAFARTYACVVPEITGDATLAFTAARYLPLAEALGERDRRYAPIDIALAGVGVLTGANMGGKTAALRTLGFVTACVALGLPVPAASARVPLVDEIAWIGIGAGAEGDGLLSAFGTEVVELQRFLARGAGRPLVLVDEFARTTSPREGRALLVALLERLRDRDAVGLAATHLADVAADAGAPHYAIGGLGPLAPADAAPLSLDAALARIARAMDYRLTRVDERAVPAADAIALAGALGLDAALVARAREAL